MSHRAQRDRPVMVEGAVSPDETDSGDANPDASSLNDRKGVEQDDEMKTSTSAPATPEEYDKAKNQIDVRYTTICKDKIAMRRKQFVFAEDPFNGSALLELEDKHPPMVIEVFIRAEGVGSTIKWNENTAAPGYGKYTMTMVDGRRVQSYSMAKIHAGDSESSVGESDTDDEDLETTEVDEKNDAPETKRTEEENLKSDFSAFRPSKVTLRSIHIHSKHLRTLFRAVIQYYPGHTLAEKKIVVNNPFLLLAHYYRELKTLRDGNLDKWLEFNHEISEEEKQYRQKNIFKDFGPQTVHDLNVVLDYFKGYYEKHYAPEEAIFESGFISFASLSFLFKPGSNVYGRVGGKFAGFIFERGEERTRNSRTRWEARCWNLTYNGRRIIRTKTTFTIREFTGAREIISMPVFPSIYLDSIDEGKTKLKLQELGKKFYDIVRTSPAHRHYEGTCWNFETSHYRDVAQRLLRKKADTEYTGEIIIDFRRKLARRRQRSISPPPRMRGDSDSSGDDVTDSEDDDYHESITLNTKAPRSKFHSIDPQENEHLTSHHYFLLPRRLDGFALSKKQRMGFDVENVLPINWPSREDMMTELILDDSDKDIIRALTRKHARTDDNWSADYIEGKGEGQIFLLHGSPGTGKTFTVECVAKSTRRPLLRLTVADIGTNEREMEDILGEWFQRGAYWGAIILIDEADVFLEKRQVRDLRRNSLVSVFLSCMEYYTGMLFLTTNRIGQIDDAFLSRISVALTYKALDVGKQRLIWQGFLKKLGEERKDIALTDRAKKFLEKFQLDETTKDIPWNGREIRNALQTAVALASYDAEKEAEVTGERQGRILVRDEHFQAVVDRRRDFINYRKSIRNQDEDARAYTEGSRGPPSKHI